MILIFNANALDNPHNINNTVNCGNCHTTNPPAGWWTDQSDESNGVCGQCHNAAGMGSDAKSHSSASTSEQYGIWSKNCTECHNPHTQQQNRRYKSESYQYTGISTGVTSSTVTKTGAVWITDQWAGMILIPNVAYQSFTYRILSNTADTITIDTGGGDAIKLTYIKPGQTFGIAYGKLVKDVVNGMQVRFFRQTGTKSFADGDATIDGICEVCHTQTMHFRNTGSSSDQLHTNIGSGLGGSKCALCHSHTAGFKLSDEMQGITSGGCITCHALTLGNRVAVVGQLNGNSHHIQGVALTNTHCYQCHWEANNDGSINNTYHNGTAVDLVIYGAGSRPSLYSTGTTAIQYSANGSRAEIQKINSHCLGCHSGQNNSTQPFGDGKTPKQYAWDGTSVAERYSQAGTTAWGKYSGTTVTPKNTQTKALSAHGNATNNQGGWDLSETWTNTRSGSVNVACYDCHNSHGSAVSGTTTSYTSDTTNGGILKDTTASKGGYSVSYKPTSGGSSGNKNAYNPGAGLCFDCHMTSTAGTMPWGYSGTFGASQKIMGYWDTPYFGPGTFGSQSRYAYKASSTHKGGHFGASSALSGSPSGTINGLCTPCHDPHGVSPSLGSNAQYAVPLLKGTWLTSLYKEDTAPVSNTQETIHDVNAGNVYHIDQNTFGTHVMDSAAGSITEDDTKFAGLCLNCHAKSQLTDGTNGGTWKSTDRIHESVKGWGANTKHKYSCSKCHTPHNSRLPRLMATNCLSTAHKGRAAFNPSPVLSGGGSNCDTGWLDPDYIGCGSGSGHFPGSGSGTDYYYSVTCHENRTGNVYDQSWNIKTQWVNSPPTVPVLIDEPNTTSTSIQLQWNPSTDPDGDAIQYYVEVDDASNFSSPNYNSGWIPGTSFTPTVGTNTTWYWRVKAKDAYTESGWSASDSFIVSDGAAPGKVTLTSPANGTMYTNYPVDVTFTWNAQPAFAEYYVDVTGTANYNSGWISGTGWAVNITTAGTYNWSVQARDTVSGATGIVSDLWTIVVNKPPTVPVLVDEPNTTSTSITLDWNASTDADGNNPVQYYAQVDNDPNFGSPDYVMNWDTAISYSFTGINNIWYWRVKARDSLNIESAWSSADSFDIYVPGTPPAAPTLYWPPDGYWGQVGYPVGEFPLQWNATSGATEYYVEYWGYSSGNSGWIAATSFNPGDLTDNNYYYWRVKARNAFGESGWSATWSWYDYWDTGGGSCPFVYVWDGEKYEYVTDLQGAPIGYSASSYLAKFVPYYRPIYVVLDTLKPDAFGKFNIKLRETLPEISYFDEAKLLSVDYPAGYELVSSTAEMTYRFNYANSFKLYAIKNPRKPVSAVDKNGSDVLASVLETEGNLLPHEISALDYYIFDFGSLDPANAKLIIDGWSVFGSAYATTLGKVQPSIEVVDGNGQWVKVKSFGEPAGDMKRMVIDLSGVFLSNDHRIRLNTGRDSGAAWRIDKVMIDDSPAVEFAIGDIPADYADLHYRGRASYVPSSYENRITAEDDVLPDDQKAYGYGNFTKYGDVKTLLAATDDRYAIMRHGDEITLTFSKPSAPIPEGMKRVYVLKSDVYYKVFRVEKNVEPLPFHGMSIYPYDPAVEHYPDDAEHNQYRLEYNTRTYP